LLWVPWLGLDWGWGMNQPMIKIDGVEITAELRRLREENEDHIQQLRKEQLEVERMHRVNAQLLEALGNMEEYSKRMGNVVSNLAAAKGGA